MNSWYFSSIIVDWIWPRKLETRIMRSMSGPEGQPEPDWTQLWTLGALSTPKSGWCYLLDFSLNPKLDTFFGQASPNLDPEGPLHLSFEPWWPTPHESTLWAIWVLHHRVESGQVGPSGSKLGLGGPSGSKIGLGWPQNGSNFGFKLNYPQFLGWVGPSGFKTVMEWALRIQIWAGLNKKCAILDSS